LNKISKKIVALATMAAFVLTLVPFAAFAAVEPDNSYIYLTGEKNVSVDLNERVNYTLELKDASGQTVGDDAKVYIWAEDEENNVTRYVNFYDNGNGTGNALSGQYIKVLNNGYALNPGHSSDGRTMAVSFTKAGTYTLHAGYVLGENTDITTTNQLVPITSVEGQNTIEVEAETVEVQSIEFDAVTPGSYVATDIDGEVATADDNAVTLKLSKDYITNGIATAKVTGTAYLDTTQNKVAANQTFTLTANKSGISLSDAEITTDRNGEFEFSFKMTKAADYKIYIENSDLQVILNVERGKAADLDTITNTTENAKTLLASDDKKYGTQGAKNFEDAVQFTITDEYGNEVTGDKAIDGQPATEGSTEYIDIVSKPEKSDLTADKLALDWSEDKQAYTLVYTDQHDAADDLVAGEYTVSVGLTSGKTAEATFTLGYFGTVKDLALDMNVVVSGTLAGGNIVPGAEVTDKVVLGDAVYGVVKYVDENGIEVVPTSAANLVVGANGDAVASDSALTGYLPAFKINTPANTEDNEKLLGTKILVTAFDNKVGKMVSTELTVVDEDVINTLAFDSENGPANKNNTVNVSIVDEEGNLVKEDGAIYAYIANQTNADANVELTVENNDQVNDGKGKLTIFSDKETEVEVVVAVKVDKTIYANTLKYTVGAESAIPADTSVVMTIGSSDFVVNNQVVSVADAAPYVANDRTYVPFRALGEALGAEVVWDNDARTVTYTLGDTTVVMTIGEKTYTVNGDERTMDVAPEITNDRTYVPVRFVGEALGFKVTALSAADGTTASVVFQK